jgi:hypothetical protein
VEPDGAGNNTNQRAFILILSIYGLPDMTPPLPIWFSPNPQVPFFIVE